jgi:hypothetical protein
MAARHRRFDKPACGAVLIIALVCMAAAGVIVLSLLQLAVAQRGAIQLETWEIQAAWMAESGLDRAAARLAADPKYRGEVWTVPAEVFGGEDSAVVRIEVDSLANEPNRRKVRVQADFPEQPQHHARQSREADIRLQRFTFAPKGPQQTSPGQRPGDR